MYLYTYVQCEAITKKKRLKFSQWEVPDFFSILTFHMNQNKAFKTWETLSSYHMLIRPNYDPKLYGLSSQK